MKKDLKLSVFHLCLGVWLIISAPLTVKSQIYSAPGGGLWNSQSTWSGGIVPSSSDNVVITSTVFVNGNACNNMSIQSGGVLQNSNANSYLLTVNGNLTNNGTISNNAGYSLSLNVGGHVSNFGIMSNYTLTLTGSGNQQIASTQPISVTNLTKNNTSGRAIATTGLNFVGTNINLNSDTLQFTSGNSITMDGGYFSTGVFYKSSLPALQITSGNGTYSYAMTIDAPQTELYGTVLIYGSGNNFKCDVVNFGTLKNSIYNSYTLSVNGDLTNYGTIQDNSYYFYLNISGNLGNHGIWTNYSTTLNGNVNQELDMSQPFTCINLVKTASAGRVLAKTDLNFIGTNIMLNNDTIQFTTGNSIAMSGGNITLGVFYKTALPALHITSGNGTYINAMTIDSPETELIGALLIYGSTCNFKTNIFNYGVLQNQLTNSYTLAVNGSLTNYGTIQDNSYYFYLNISGNLGNHGTWTNYSTTLNGNVNQELDMSQPFTCINLIKTASAGRVVAKTSLNFVGTNIILNNDTLEFTTGNSITMSGGNVTSAVFYKSSLPALQITSGNGTYINAVTIDSPQTELNGALLIYGNINNFKTNIINYGVLQNHITNNYYLAVNGSLTNYGTIQNNSYFLYLNISGNLGNHGTWTNYSTTLNGNGNQELAMTQPLGCLSFIRNASAGRVLASTGLNFIGTTITFNNDTLEFTTGNSLTISGGYLYSGVLYKPSMPQLLITSGNGTYFNEVTIDSPQTELYGSLLIYGNVNNFKNNIINYGTLQNRTTNAHNLTINGNLTNNGTIQNNSYNFNLIISGNVTNNNIWKNAQTSLTGTANHYFAFANRFEGGILINNNPTAGLIATTDLNFEGTDIDLNGSSLSMADGSQLSIRNGYLFNAEISGNDIHFHSLGSYCQYVGFADDVTLHGVFQAGTGVSFDGSIINLGILRNIIYNSYGILVQGEIHNYGSITDNVYNFTITVLGDIYNSGVWSNYATILDGTSDQYIYLINNRQIQGAIRLDANFSGSGFTWWGPSGVLTGNSNFSGASSQVLLFLNPVTDEFIGQYHCVNTQSVSSRYIFINSQVRSALDITVLLEGLYEGSGLMHPAMDATGNSVFSAVIADQITIELHDISNFDNVVVSVPEVLLYTDGSAYAVLPAGYTGSYYLAIKHRNSIETVSAMPVSILNSEGEYDFNMDTKAFGSNLILLSDGWYAIFGGDVNQDRVVDTGDMTPVENGSSNFLAGYLVTDANGDGVTDTGDMTIVENNSAQFVMVAHP